MSTVPTLALRVSGHRDMPCLVLGNALGTDTEIWAAQEIALAERFFVVRFDLPGHGESAESTYGSLADLARAVLAALEGERISSFAYAGLSMGAAIGMELARMVPHRMRALILANTSASFGPAAFWDGRIAQAENNGVASLADAAVSRWLTPAFARANPPISAGLAVMFSKTRLSGYVQACRAIRDFDSRKHLSAISVPTLIVAGAEDEATPQSNSQELHRAIPGSRYIALPAAHLANIGCSSEFSVALSSFLTAQAFPEINV